MVKKLVKTIKLNNFKYYSLQDGFTFIELLVVMTILTVVFSLAMVNIGNIIPKADLRSSLEVIISDLKQQQNKAMLGDTEGRPNNTAYGVHFDQDQYVLFYGDSYDPAESSNMIFELSEVLEFQNINLPNSNVIFAINSGELLEYVDQDFQLIVHNTANSQSMVITINKFGVIDIN